jgi:hypothetical protein
MPAALIQQNPVFIKFVTLNPLSLIMWTKIETLKSKAELTSKPGNAYYFIENAGVCYNAYPIAKADAETFVWQLDFAKDKNRCYRMGEAFQGADPGTFEVLNAYFCKDRNHIYNPGGIDKKVDYETFEVLDTGYELDELNKAKKITSYSKDKNGLWMMEYYSYKPVSIKGIDTTTFERIDSCYARDKKFVLWCGKKLKKAQPSTFIALNSNYGKDDKHIFAQDAILENADYETFGIIENNITLAKDKHHYYQFGEVISQQEFQELAEMRK